MSPMFGMTPGEENENRADDWLCDNGFHFSLLSYPENVRLRTFENLQHVSVGIDEVANTAAPNRVHLVACPLNAFAVQPGLCLFEIAYTNRHVRPAGGPGGTFGAGRIVHAA